MSITGALIGKIAIAAAGLGLGGFGAFNMATTGCIFGACSVDKGAATVSVSDTADASGGGCCPLTGAGEVVEVASTSGTCEAVCAIDECSPQACEEAGCESECSSESAVVLASQSSEKDACAVACASTEKVADAKDCEEKAECDAPCEGIKGETTEVASNN